MRRGQFYTPCPGDFFPSLSCFGLSVCGGGVGQAKPREPVKTDESGLRCKSFLGRREFFFLPLPDPASSPLCTCYQRACTSYLSARSAPAPTKLRRSVFWMGVATALLDVE